MIQCYQGMCVDLCFKVGQNQCVFGWYNVSYCVINIDIICYGVNVQCYMVLVICCCIWYYCIVMCVCMNIWLVDNVDVGCVWCGN